MICPHCNKSFRWNKSQKTRQQVVTLSKKGYSCRDIESKLGIAFSTAARIIREETQKIEEG